MKSGNNRHFHYFYMIKGPLMALLVLISLAACTSQATREAELAALQSARIAAEQEASRVAEERQLQQAAAEARRQQVMAAEQARRQAELAEQERQQALAQAEAEARQQAEREKAQRIEREQRQAIARAEAERSEKLTRIEELEQHIARLNASTAEVESANEVLSEALAVAEELLDVLTMEQAKYDNTDANGRTIEPLSKGLIADLMAQRNSLAQEIDPLTQ